MPEHIRLESTTCSVHALKYLDHQARTISVSCYFDRGEHWGKSKGLLELAKDLKVSVYSSMKLPGRRPLVADYPDFRNISKLERLAHKYNVKIIFVPKFHWVKCHWGLVVSHEAVFEENHWSDISHNDATYSRISRELYSQKDSIEALSTLLVVSKCL